MSTIENDVRETVHYIATDPEGEFHGILWDLGVDPGTIPEDQLHQAAARYARAALAVAATRMAATLDEVVQCRRRKTSDRVVVANTSEALAQMVAADRLAETPSASW